MICCFSTHRHMHAALLLFCLLCLHAASAGTGTRVVYVASRTLYPSTCVYCILRTYVRRACMRTYVRTCDLSICACLAVRGAPSVSQINSGALGSFSPWTTMRLTSDEGVHTLCPYRIMSYVGRAILRKKPTVLCTVLDRHTDVDVRGRGRQQMVCERP